MVGFCSGFPIGSLACVDESCCDRAQLKVALGSRECGLTMLNAEPSHKHMACMDDGDAFEPSSRTPGLLRGLEIGASERCLERTGRTITQVPDTIFPERAKPA